MEEGWFFEEKQYLQSNEASQWQEDSEKLMGVQIKAGRQ